MKIVYFGSGEVSKGVLENLLSFVKPLAVITKPDAPKGRGKRVLPTPVKELAISKGIKVLTPKSLKDGGFLSELKALNPDFIMLADYGGILPKEVLEIPRLYPLCFHPSPLPKYRGASPIERAFFNCDDFLGLTVFVMNEKIDEGEIVMQDKIPLNPCENTKGEVLPEITKRGAKMLYDSANMILEGFRNFKPQIGESSYAPRLKREEEFINPNEGVKRTVGKINGLSPKPGARYVWRGKNLKLLKARPYRDGFIKGDIGEFFYEKGEKKLLLICSDGCAEIITVKVEGKNPISGYDFANGYLKQP
ncbi:MAG: methionyl-tRNA formyltransferase [candidate division WOR-3 bacterium]